MEKDDLMLIFYALMGNHAKSLNFIIAWCKENGLRISAMKTHSVMFTWERECKFSKPLKIDNDTIVLKSSSKFLGVTLDSKLTWNEPEHIIIQCKKAKGILMQCRRAVVLPWGLSSKTIK